MDEKKLSHINEQGDAQMVDVGDKQETERIAIASGEVLMKSETLELIRDDQIKKGDVLTVAKVAGISAAKKTSEMIPLCHPLPLNHISIDFEFDDELPGVRITALVKTNGKTGVEMEALTAVSISALTIYDMVKAVEKTMTIQNVRLIEKRGGKSGVFLNE
jgi:cyclic pyranopterin phosphate synthase